jgi:hypothetical protein
MELSMEKITEIKDYEAKEDNIHVAGFEVLTDKQSIKLYIDNDAKCCENWGHFWCNENPHDFIGAELRDVTLTNKALNKEVMQAKGPNHVYKLFEGEVMFVNLETDRGTLQFVAYNEHNGYYGHDAKVQCNQLTHEECL